MAAFFGSLDGGAAGEAKHPRDGGQRFGGIDWFGKIRVHAAFETGIAVLRHGAGGQGDDGNVRDAVALDPRLGNISCSRVGN
jgi:hypothetical protein